MFGYGQKIRIQIFGQSHSKGIGVIIDGLPAGESIDLDELAVFLKRRAPGRNTYSTMRKEADEVEIISGLVDGKSCGAPICAIIYNKDRKSGDYDNLRKVPRPGHSDFPAYIKYGGENDIRGGGQFSGRLTAPLCVAGGILKQLLEKRGVFIGGHILSVRDIKDDYFDPVKIDEKTLREITKKEFTVIDDKKGALMRSEILKAQENLDSVGGLIEVAATGLDIGLGSHMFGGVENLISAVVFGVPAVKGIEFGAGFAAAEKFGSKNNDEYIIDEGKIKTITNHSGGVLGGMTNGMPLILRVAIKPTPSMSAMQKSVNLDNKSGEELKIIGRHDPCIVPRAVPCIESAVAIALAELVLFN